MADAGAQVNNQQGGANEGGGNIAGRPRIIAPKKRSLRSLVRRRYDLPTTHLIPRIVVGGEQRNCIVFVPDDIARDRGLVFSLALKKAKLTNDERDMCAFVGSMLMVMLPSLKPVLLKSFPEFGITPVEVKIPSEAEDYQVVLDDIEDVPWQTILVQGSCILLMLFKDGTEETYLPYMTTRIRELKSKAGTSEEIDIPFDLKEAQLVRTCLGPQLSIAVINELISHFDGEDTLSRVLSYVSSMLEYNGMNAFMFIYDTLLVPRSHVLRNPEIQYEVANLSNALKAISKCDYPQFARYLLPTYQQTCLDRSRFPILFALACKIKSRKHGANLVRQFFATPPISSPLVQSLFMQYEAEMRGSDRTDLPKTIECMTMDIEDEYLEDD